MIPLDDALAHIRGAITPLEAERIPVADAAGRTLSAPAISVRTQPPFDGSAMDGYAVRASDLSGAETRLRLAGEAAAGHASPAALEPGAAMRISTGAPLPGGADQVVVQENATPEDDCVRLAATPQPGHHVRPAGLDFREGDTLLTPGTRLTPSAVSLLAAAGLTTVDVARRPVIGVLCNGDELVEPGEETRPDQIVNSIAPGLLALVRAWGGDTIYLGIAPDDAAAVRDRLSRHENLDLLVTVGGASVGDHDHLRRVFTELGGQTVFDRIAVKPGKPTWFGRLEDTFVLGLPGNPVSALVMAQLCLRTAMDALAGRAHAPVFETARAGTKLAGNGPRETFLRARLDPRTREASPLANQDSSALTALVAADCLIRRQAHAAPCDAGTRVDILPLGAP